MQTHKIIIKLFVENDTFGPTDFLPVFHRWIQTHALADHLLIDVADYAHVPGGPGTLVVASEANIHMDRSENRLGLMYVRKQPITGATNFGETLKAVLKYTFAGAKLMEDAPELAGRLKFNLHEISVRLNDRLLTPNAPETIEEYYPLVAAQAAKLFPGQAVTVEPHSKSPKELIDLRIKSAGKIDLIAL